MFLDFGTKDVEHEFVEAEELVGLVDEYLAIVDDVGQKMGTSCKERI